MKRMNKYRTGYTLMEMLVSTSVASILMVGMGSSIYVASQTFESEDKSPAQTARADNTLGQVMRDAQAATEILELTATTAEFKVPDRDGDGYEETIRYAWSGTPGDPLTYQLNGGTVDTIAENVEAFQLDYLSRLIEGSGETKSLLFVSGESKVDEDGSGATKEEQEAMELMKSWSFEVVAVSQSSSADEFSKYIAEADVIFVSRECNLTIGGKINNLSVGVVCEQYDYSELLGFGEDNRTDSDDTIVITDNSHYITSEFKKDKDLKVFSEKRLLMGIDDDEGYANDMQTLATLDGSSSAPSLVILDVGDTDYNGREISNRRVMLPWGATGNDPSLFTNDGETIVKRSLEWAAEGGEEGALISQPIKEGADIVLPSDSNTNWWQGWLR